MVSSSDTKSIEIKILIYFCKIAKRLEPRSGLTYAGPDLTSRIFVSSTIFFFKKKKKSPKLTFFNLIQLFPGSHVVSQHVMGSN